MEMEEKASIKVIELWRFLSSLFSAISSFFLLKEQKLGNKGFKSGGMALF